MPQDKLPSTPEGRQPKKAEQSAPVWRVLRGVLAKPKRTVDTGVAIQLLLPKPARAVPRRNRIWLTLLHRLPSFPLVLGFKWPAIPLSRRPIFKLAGHEKLPDYTFWADSEHNRTQNMDNIGTERCTADFGHVECIHELKLLRDGRTAVQYEGTLRHNFGTNIRLTQIHLVTGPTEPVHAVIPAGGPNDGIQRLVRVAFPRNCSPKLLSDEDRGTGYGAVAEVLLEEGAEKYKVRRMMMSLSDPTSADFDQSLYTIVKDVLLEYDEIRQLYDNLLREQQEGTMERLLDVELPLSGEPTPEQEEALMQSLYQAQKILKEVCRRPSYLLGARDGWKVGHDEGFDEGRADGLGEGRADGLDEGRADGLDEGLKQGHVKGKRDERIQSIQTVLAMKNLTLLPEQVEQLQQKSYPELPSLESAFEISSVDEFWQLLGPTEANEQE